MHSGGRSYSPASPWENPRGGLAQGLVWSNCMNDCMAHRHIETPMPIADADADAGVVKKIEKSVHSGFMFCTG